jgi:putative ABC transport system substrate-binding protein
VTIPISRRSLFIAAGLLAAEPTAIARAQTKKVARLGFLGIGPASAWRDQIGAFKGGLSDLGYAEGSSYVIDFKWADAVGDLSGLTEELVRSRVDIIIAPASTEVDPASKATRTIPIVFVQHADPVGLGHVTSLAHPGGNITGVSMVLTEIAAKSLEILKDAIPSAKRIGVLWNPTTPSHGQVFSAVKAAAKELNLQILSEPIRVASDFDGVFADMAEERADGFLVPSSPLSNTERAPLAQLALKYKLPSMFVNEANVEAGGLMSYGADFNYMYRHAALYVDKILKGTAPADLPVEQASKYLLVINMRTAKAIGLDISPAMLARADKTID